MEEPMQGPDRRYTLGRYTLGRYGWAWWEFGDGAKVCQGRMPWIAWWRWFGVRNEHYEFGER